MSGIDSPPTTPDPLPSAEVGLATARAELRDQLARVRRLKWTARLALFKQFWLEWATALRQLIAQTVRWKLGVMVCLTTLHAGLALIFFDSPLLAAVVALAMVALLTSLLTTPSDAVLPTALKLAQFARVEAVAQLDAAVAEVPGLQAVLRGRLLAHAEARAESARLEVGRRADHRLATLASSNWRLLRAAEWEGFLKLVFTELGYQVELTGMSGDQGVDLVLRREGRKIAVQAKGYAGGVPNSSVQQAYAGQGFYECHACAVITNSRFTESARELAGKLGCVLVDEERLIRIMNRQVDFWRLCFRDQPHPPAASRTGAEGESIGSTD